MTSPYSTVPQFGHVLVGRVQCARQQIAFLAQLRDRRRRPARLGAERGRQFGFCMWVVERSKRKRVGKSDREKA
jgi:hypothetical protein